MNQRNDRHAPHQDRATRDVTDDRLHPSLPVTAEVGGEGGSYADPTQQVATFEDDLPRTRGAGGASSVANQAVRHDVIAGGGIGSAPDPDHGMIRYPTESPNLPITTEGRHLSGPNWRAGAFGAAAGAVAVLGLELLRRRNAR